MGEGSKIEWTDHTFNPWMGCTKVSPAACSMAASGANCRE
jgi:protein gp37